MRGDNSAPGKTGMSKIQAACLAGPDFTWAAPEVQILMLGYAIWSGLEGVGDGPFDVAAAQLLRRERRLPCGFSRSVAQ